MKNEKNGDVKKQRKSKIKYIITEEFKTNIPNPTEEDLRKIFNLKFYNYIKNKENRIGTL